MVKRSESKGPKSKGAWTAEEDEKLASYVKLHGDKKWKSLPAKAGLNRCGKSCRLRWLNYLRPGIKRGNISEDEEDLIIRLHNLLGNRWSLIAGRLPGRTDNEIKNHWNTHLSKKSLTIKQLNHKLNQKVEFNGVSLHGPPGQSSQADPIYSLIPQMEDNGPENGQPASSSIGPEAAEKEFDIDAFFDFGAVEMRGLDGVLQTLVNAELQGENRPHLEEQTGCKQLNLDALTRLLEDEDDHEFFSF